MAILDAKFRVVNVDRNGLRMFEVTGRCTADEQTDIEDACTWRYEMVAVPNGEGAILKAMDGTLPLVVQIAPPTMSKVFNCVKVGAWCNPHAPAQPAGSPYAGQTILFYMVRYQETSGTA